MKKSIFNHTNQALHNKKEIEKIKEIQEKLDKNKFNLIDNKFKILKNKKYQSKLLNKHKISEERNEKKLFEQYIFIKKNKNIKKIEKKFNIIWTKNNISFK